MNIYTHNIKNKELLEELENKGWNITNSVSKNTDILLYNSERNKLTEIMKNINNNKKLLIVNSISGNTEAIVNNIEKKAYSSIFK